ncbi:MAG: hypothetical protein IK999_00075 [Ruminococcus sp.]|nr:hypothetical protein [Ruminococcus sp.]
MKGKKLYTCKEAIVLVDGLTEYMTRKMIKDGRLIPVKLGRNIYVTREAVFNAVFGENIESKKSTDTDTENKKYF